MIGDFAQFVGFFEDENEERTINKSCRPLRGRVIFHENRGPWVKASIIEDAAKDYIGITQKYYHRKKFPLSAFQLEDPTFLNRQVSRVIRKQSIYDHFSIF